MQKGREKGWHVRAPRREPAAEISRNQTKPQGPSQTGGEVAAKRARGEGGTGRRQCRRCRAGARRTARSRTPPPSASPTSTPTSRSAVESSCPHPSRRARIYGGVRCPRCIGTYGFLRFLMILFAGSRCGDREGHQPRGEPAQGAPPAQCVDSPFILASDFFFA